jgi:hypothetical protein
MMAPDWLFAFPLLAANVGKNRLEMVRHIREEDNNNASRFLE